MSFLDKVEKLGKIKSLEKDFTPAKNKSDLGLLMIVTFIDKEQDYFQISRETAVDVLETIFEKLEEEDWGPIIFHNKQDRQGKFGNLEELKDFKGMLMIDETIRSVRVIDPNELPGKED